jgi:hypothetical protein
MIVGLRKSTRHTKSQGGSTISGEVKSLDACSLSCALRQSLFGLADWTYPQRMANRPVELQKGPNALTIEERYALSFVKGSRMVVKINIRAAPEATQATGLGVNQSHIDLLD